jgi:hypothetical protein
MIMTKILILKRRNTLLFKGIDQDHGNRTVLHATKTV